MKILVGLGNPGKEYEWTRHNVGFLLVDYMSEKFDFGSWKMKKNLECEMIDGKINNERIVLIKPMTYMNNSGRAVRRVVDFFDIDNSDLYICHDDMDLDFENIQIKMGGGTAGHHGLESIIQHLGGAGDFLRLRVGIGKTGKKVLDSSKGGKYVVGKFTDEEIKKMPEILNRIEEAFFCCLDGDLEKCMTKYNKKISSNLLME